MIDVIGDLSKSYYGNYRTRKFNDIYANVVDFKNDFEYFSQNGLNPNFKDSAILNTIYLLLTAKYGNSHIVNSSEPQFKLRLFSYIFQFGPNWEKELSIQSRLRELSEEELRIGTRQVINHAYNPATEPSTKTLDELPYVNEQNAIKFQKNILDGYSTLTMLLKKDVTEQFLNKFKKLFIQIVEPDCPLYYIENINEEE